MNKFIVSIITLLIALVYVNAQPDKFAEGVWAGEDAAEDLFNQLGGCDSAWSFGEDAKAVLVEGTFGKEPGDNPLETMYKRGGKRGVETVIKEKEEECFNQGTQCEDVGEAVASMIAAEACDSMLSRGRPDFREICIEESIDTCEYKVRQKVRACAPDVTNEQLGNEAAKCDREVRTLVNRRRLRGGKI